MTFLDLYRAGYDTAQIAQLEPYRARVTEAEIYNEIARLKGKTEPHPDARSKSSADNARVRAGLREIRERHSA